MTHARLSRFDLEDPIHGQVPCALLAPAQQHAALPLCLFLYGGGGSRESLLSLQPMLEAAWHEGTLAPCVVATPDVGPMSFYLDDPERGYAWESFITQRFVPQLRVARNRCAVVGVSMGGYGALKLAFQHPRLFAAVAAVSPMLEPYTGGDPDAVPLRNRYFYPPEVPQALLGPKRDAALYRADHPTARARKHAQEIMEHNLSIYIDAAGRDCLHAHDGAESLHRELWAQDIPHEYHLRKDADHVGPDQAPRLLTALQWVLCALQPPAAPELSADERPWQTWLDDPTQAQPLKPLPPASGLFPAYLRALTDPPRKDAAKQDPTVHRHYGLL
jgi:S-formylglutathione hydrolase